MNWFDITYFLNFWLIALKWFVYSNSYSWLIALKSDDHFRFDCWLIFLIDRLNMNCLFKFSFIYEEDSREHVERQYKDITSFIFTIRNLLLSKLFIQNRKNTMKSISLLSQKVNESFHVKIRFESNSSNVQKKHSNHRLIIKQWFRLTMLDEFRNAFRVILWNQKWWILNQKITLYVMWNSKIKNINYSVHKMKLLNIIFFTKIFSSSYWKMNHNTRFEECREDFSKNEALTQKLNCMMRNVFICMLISNRRIFHLNQETNVMKISIMFSTITKFRSKWSAFSYELNEERFFSIDEINDDFLKWVEWNTKKQTRSNENDLFEWVEWKRFFRMSWTKTTFSNVLSRNHFFK
jgi:hypothetical protein